jgi:hypothetical protein
MLSQINSDIMRKNLLSLHGCSSKARYTTPRFDVRLFYPGASGRQITKSLELWLFIVLLLLPFMRISAQTGPGGVANPLVWFKANAGTSTTISGTGIATWVNQAGGGNGTQVTAGNRPTYQTGSTEMINFNPVVKFNDANSQFFDLSANIFGNGTARTAANMFVLAKNSTLTTNSSIWWEDCDRSPGCPQDYKPRVESAGNRHCRFRQSTGSRQ